MQTSAQTIEFGAAQRTEPARRQAAHQTCFHCGTVCRSSSFQREEKAFCCQGCLTVFELLTENGLSEFYRLGDAAGVRITGTPKANQFKFLDEPTVRESLVDFSNAQLTRATFHLPSIHCIACVWLLENLFRLRAGIGQSRVNFPRKEVSLAFDTAAVRLSEVVALLTSLGYEPELKLSVLDAKPRRRAARRLWIQLGLAGFAFGNIMLFSISAYLGLDAFAGPAFRRLVGAISLVLAVPVVIYSAADYWRAAWTSLRQRLLNIDVPIAAGVAAIFLQSTCEVISGRGDGYFDSLTGLIFFLLCGKLFQRKTYERLAFDRDYKSFFPLSVTRKISNEETKEEQVSLAQLQIGDQLVIRNGELIPADSRLVSGSALIDYSFVTGESEPIEKKPGDYLYAGGRQVGSAVEVEAVKPVSQSYLTSLWNQEAFRKNKSEALNEITNKYSQRFTKLVILIAVCAAALWAFVNPAISLKAFTAVLIVACPCALALAAPFALGSTQRVLAQRNVFLKCPDVIERLARVDAIVFDKTGTLTVAGAGSVVWRGARDPSIYPKPDSDFSSHLRPDPLSTESGNHSWSLAQKLPDDRQGLVGKRLHGHERFLLSEGEGQGEGEPALRLDEERWLYSMTRHSTHPLPVRIGAAIAREHFPEPVRSFFETPGCGMEGNVEGHEIWMGAAAWLESCGAKPDNITEIHPNSIQGSVVHVAIDGKYRGCFVLASALRMGTDKLLAELSKDFEVALLSGDDEKERTRFEALFGNGANLHFAQSPQDKLGFIRRLQHCGKTVMMVGDGLNDAGALKQSDVGVAVVENISSFSPASDVIMKAEMVSRMNDVLRYAKQSVRVVRAAFLISAVYNAVGVTIAARGVLSPLVCAILMPLSSVTVVAFGCGAATLLGLRLVKPAVQP